MATAATRLYREADPYNLTAAPADEELKRQLIDRLIAMPESRLKARLARQAREGRAPTTNKPGVTDDPMLITRVLDTTVGTTGNVLPRVDLEPTVYALFVKKFPWFDRIQKGPSNGIVHTWNVMEYAGSAADSTLALATELTATTDDTATYKQFNVANIATFDTQRGVSLKELFATRQSGMAYSPENMELYGGTIMLKRMIQKQILQGNFSVASGTASNEAGAFSGSFFDGLRLQTSSTAPYNLLGGGSQVDMDKTAGGGPFTITEGVNYAVSQVIDKGGEPTILVMSATSKMAFMNEQEGKQRTETAEIIPGVKVQTAATLAGDLPIAMVPGAANALGTYNRASDGVLVEDIYVLDETNIHLRYIGSPDINVIEIPVGVDGKLSRRFILFAFFGLQIADNGVFQAKVRRPV